MTVVRPFVVRFRVTRCLCILSGGISMKLGTNRHFCKDFKDQRSKVKVILRIKDKHQYVRPWPVC